MLVELFPIPTGAKNALIKAGFITIDDFKGKTSEEIKKIPGFGLKSLAELKEYLAGKGIRLARQKKAATGPKCHPRSKEIVNLLLGHKAGKFNWPKEMKNASTLIERYGFDNVARLTPDPKVFSLTYYLGDWAAKLILKDAKIRVVPEMKKEKEEEDLSDIVYRAKKPEKAASLMDFLGIE